MSDNKVSDMKTEEETNVDSILFGESESLKADDPKLDSLSKDTETTGNTTKLESIFAEDENTEAPKKVETSKTVATVEKPETVGEKLQDTGELLKKKHPQLLGRDFPESFMEIVERVNFQYDMLPAFDYEVIYDELSELSVQSHPTPTIQVINDEIQKVQAAKDRLSEIFINVHKSYTLKKRAVDILKDSWVKFSVESSADKRKGDTAHRFSDYELDLANTEGLFKACTHILKNLDSLHDGLSRRITVNQLLLKMHDVGRGALPDYDWNQTDVNNIIGENNQDDIDPTERMPAREESF